MNAPPTRSSLFCTAVLMGLLRLLPATAGRAQPSEKTERFEDVRSAIARLPDTTRIARLIRFNEQKSNRYQFDEAHQALAEALRTAQQMQDKGRIAQVYMALGLCYGKQNNYLQALHQYQQALLNLRRSSQAELVDQLYIHIGNAYQHALEPRRAELYYKKIINAKTPRASLLNQSYAYGGLANLADQDRNAQKALDYNRKALAIAKQLARWDEYYSKLANIAFNYSDLNRPREAVMLYNQCMRYAEHVSGQKRPNPVFERHFRMAIYDGMPYPLITLGRFDEAERYARLALRYGDLDNGYQDLHRMWVYDALTLLYEKKGDHPKAFSAYKQWAIYRDKIQSQAHVQRFSELETLYQAKEKEQQLKELDATHAQQTQQLWAGVGGLVLLLLLLVTVSWQYRRIQRSRTKIQQQSNELAMMMRELHHRIKNNLAIVSSLLKLQSKQLEDENAVQAIRTSQQRVMAMSLIHQRLYQTEKVTIVNMREYIVDLTNTLVQTYNYVPEAFDLQIRVEQEDVALDIAMPLGLIINELMTNAFKHAFGKAQRPFLGITLLNQNGLVLEVQDNGQDIDQAYWQQFSSGDSFGNRLINSLCEQLEGHYRLINRNGMLFRLYIPEKTLAAS